MPLAPGIRFGPYQIAALIGVGGMGEVYRAGDINLNRDVAIKILPESLAGDADRIARFRREAEILASLNHPNIAHVYGLERTDTMTVLVMELVEGPTLADRIAEGPLPLAEALSIAQQVADALEAAHQRAIVHRDLKPANIKLRADGAVKVLDFGIAKAVQPTLAASGAEPPVANTPSLTQMGMILGTAAYMSPEQARGKAVDKRTDVWAFGCVLYEMLTGQPAFTGEDATITIGRVLEREVDMSRLPGSVPSSVRQTLKACLQKDPKRRLRDIGDVRLALEGAFESPAESASAHAGRHRLSLAGAFIAGVVVVALAAWRLWPAPEPRAVTRLSLPIEVTEQFVSISRDGSRVAYRSGPERSIRVRDLDEFEARRIPGTDGAAIDFPPCFSPDGTSIAFFAAGRQLRKVSLSGGVPLTMAQGFSGASVCDWGEDGHIYFSTNSGVMRVPEAGGMAELVIAPNAERNEISFQAPRLLPGGERVLYSVYGAEGADTARVDVLDLTTRERATVLAGVGISTYVPARRDARRGYLVYGSGGALFAAAFDPVRGETGPARLVASEVIGLGAFSSGAVSESGTLAYLSPASFDTADVDPGATLITVDREGAERVVSAEPQLYGEVTFSPDGSRAILTTQAAQTSSIIDLWVYELDGDRMSRLTLDGANIGAVWTADSRRVLYMHSRPLAGAPEISQLRSVPADDSVPPSTIEGSMDWIRGIAYPTSLSPDGRTLLAVNDELAAADVLAFELDGGLEPKTIGAPRDFLVTSFREHGAAFSPDGSLVAYSSDQSGTEEIYIVPYPGPGGRLQVSRGGGALPRWNSNGRELLYVSGGNLMAVEVETVPALRASAPRALFAIPPLASYGGLPYDVSPDGTQFLMLKAPARSEQVDLRVVVNWIDEFERVAQP